MTWKRWIRWAAACCIALILPLYSAAAYYACHLPDSFYVATGSTLEVDTLLHIDTSGTAETVQAASSQSDSRTETLELLGLVPIKTVEIEEIDTPMLVPCGQPFGIKLRMGGAMVVEMGDVKTLAGSYCPAQEAGIQIGDLIQSVDDVAIDSNQALQEAIQASEGKAVSVTLVRESETITCVLTPAFALDDCCYEAGIWVRDSSAGIGTITYYMPSTGTFGGLGHPVCDSDTGEILPVSSGEACAVSITEVIKGSAGSPGLLQGIFLDCAPLGTLSCNNRCGVFGTMTESPSDAAAVPMGFKQEIEVGEAEIYCTISGDTPQVYDITIEEIDYSGTDNTRNMVISVTDPELLEITGGIVQGMSGSPILQNGKLVGAVTHVFVDDPTQGYAIFCENMLRYGT